MAKEFVDESSTDTDSEPGAESTSQSGSSAEGTDTDNLERPAKDLDHVQARYIMAQKIAKDIRERVMRTFLNEAAFGWMDRNSIQAMADGAAVAITEGVAEAQEAIQASQKRFDFFKLSSEIRNSIFEDVLGRRLKEYFGPVISNWLQTIGDEHAQKIRPFTIHGLPEHFLLGGVSKREVLETMGLDQCAVKEETFVISAESWYCGQVDGPDPKLQFK
ncbi:hypothetical protein TI39_contig4413g00001 [Zymoseptoria brevis]|uniref:Uncharacterized protein n=1 Tax=Zymoseptoria brevis TaxID=1047168 RepID=A0A0F4G6V7_9PEZI|nr:hypothetical protein TI39_contig4413g00001 [Zymoseptoria brevis]